MVATDSYRLSVKETTVEEFGRRPVQTRKQGLTVAIAAVGWTGRGR
jgi:hypothetical protein